MQLIGWLFQEHRWAENACYAGMSRDIHVASPRLDGLSRDARNEMSALVV
jgi:hypothetical protein